MSRLSSDSLVIFVASTTGQGDTPNNMKSFWRELLRKNLPPDLLSHMSVAVFGLGDSSYNLFNVVAKRLSKRLTALGAGSLCALGLGNDQDVGGYDTELEPWLANLWQVLSSRFPLPSGVSLPPQNQRPLPRYSVQICTNPDEENNQHQQHHPQQQQHNTAHPFEAVVCENVRLTANDHWQDVRHIDIDLGDSGMSYRVGDVLCVKPTFPEGEILSLLQRLELNPDDVVTIRPNDPDTPTWPYPQPRRLFDLFSKDLDSLGVPRRYFFELLAHVTSDQLQKERLQELSSPEGAEDLAKYCFNERRTYAEIFQDFTSAKPDLSTLLDLINPLKPRMFSISSSLQMHPNKVHITVALVSFTTPYKRRIVGVCSRYLGAATAGHKVRIWTEESMSFRFNALEQADVLMIGPGTGVAPFRAYLQELEAVRRDANLQAPGGEARLYFGCRNRTKDFLYEQEWEGFANNQVLTELHVAFSRDQPTKVYVQHLLGRPEDRKVIWRILGESSNGKLYLAGSSKNMPSDVMDAIVEAFTTEGGMDEDEARKALRKLELAGRIMMETWA
eukprot:c45440_g1_i1.p1 GENE.c45440_g1_i1~~c45440_g1_i1.p1  ORF type:complete len:601 (+),score=127.00 c45440_g1_i1:129-1805(+)